MLPSIFGENLIDDMCDYVFDSMSGFERRNPLYGKHAKNMMKTDVRETESTYELDVDLPGFKKDEIKVALKNGYLTLAAEKGIDKESENIHGRYIRKERYVGSNSRSFYVGEDVQQEDIKAEFKHGILKLFVPKKEAKPAVEEKKHIAIEGELFPLQKHILRE